MAALAKDRDTRERGTALHEGPVAAAVKCFAGAFAVLDADGNIKPAVTATGLVGLGRFEEYVDNSAGLAGAVTAKVKRGVFRWENSAAGDAIAKAEIGDICYLVDDQTVAKTDGGGTRSRAGIVADVDSQGVWVDTSTNVLNTPAGGLLAASNLNDVGNKATSRNNLGVAEKMGAPTIVIGAENAGAGTINVTIQLKDAAGVDLAVRGSVTAYLSDDAAGDSIAAAAPSGGWAIGVDGLLIPQVANKAALLVSEADGDIDITITEAGAATWYLILVMPDGKLVASDAITFA